jgi:hypothetical protein
MPAVVTDEEAKDIKNLLDHLPDLRPCDLAAILHIPCYKVTGPRLALHLLSASLGVRDAQKDRGLGPTSVCSGGPARARRRADPKGHACVHLRRSTRAALTARGVVKTIRKRVYDHSKPAMTL